MRGSPARIEKIRSSRRSPRLSISWPRRAALVDEACLEGDAAEASLQRSARIWTRAKPRSSSAQRVSTRVSAVATPRRRARAGRGSRSRRRPGRRRRCRRAPPRWRPPASTTAKWPSPSFSQPVVGTGRGTPRVVPGVRRGTGGSQRCGLGIAAAGDAGRDVGGVVTPRAQGDGPVAERRLACRAARPRRGPVAASLGQEPLDLRVAPCRRAHSASSSSARRVPTCGSLAPVAASRP